MKTLIVDDEAISRKILAHMMGPLGEVVAASEGKTAIELFRQAMNNGIPFDLLTLDVSMPGMDGMRVLRYIRTLEKSRALSGQDTIKIIMRSSRMSRSVIQKCISLGCDDFIAKPVSESRLFQKLTELGLTMPAPVEDTDPVMHPKVMGEIIRKFYKGRIRLPVLPRMVREIETVLARADHTVDELAAVIEKDPVLSGKLIRIANSPLYRGMDAVTDLKAGLVRLGVDATHAVVATIANKLLFESDNASLKTVLEQHWRHSFAAACCGKLIAEEIAIENSDTVFLMGITFDLGNVLLLKAVADISPEVSFEDQDLLRSIHEVHTTFGAALLKKWKFPEVFVKLAELHHWNEFPPDMEEEIPVVHLADFLAEKIGFGFPGLMEFQGDKDREQGIAEVVNILDIEPDTLVKLEGQAKTVVTETIKAF